MSSALERFQNRNNPAMVFTVPWPLENPKIEFTVRRMPQAVMNNASIDIEGTLTRLGVKRPEDVPMMIVEVDKDGKEVEVVHPEWQIFNRVYGVWFALHLVEQGRDQFTGWKSLVEGVTLPSFSTAALTRFLAELSNSEIQILGMSYRIQEAKADTEAEEKKANARAGTEPAS